MYRDRRVWAYIPRMFWRRGARAILAQTRRFVRLGTAYWFVIAERRSGKFVGEIGLFNIDWEERTAELGYVISRTQWGKGFATEASRRLCKLAFRILKLRRLDAIAGEGNHASFATLQKLGFHLEGVSRKAVWLNRGWRDAYRFGLLSSEYRAQRSEP